MSAPLYFEQKVADRLGISRRDLKYIRDEVLKKDVGWCFSGRDVALTERGCETVLKRLRAMSIPLPNDIDFANCLVPTSNDTWKKNGVRAGGNGCEAPPPQSAHVDDLIVHRTYPNPRLLEARTAGGKLVTVLVKNNTNFRPKMALRARLVRAGRYEMEGRCPRFPGRY